MLRSALWNPLAKVLAPEAVPSEPWQALHFSVATTVRRGSSVPAMASSCAPCCTGVFTNTVGVTSGRTSVSDRICSIGSLICPMLTTRAVPVTVAASLSSGSGMFTV